MTAEKKTAKAAAVETVTAVADQIAKQGVPVDYDVALQVAQVQATLALVDAVEANNALQIAGNALVAQTQEVAVETMNRQQAFVQLQIDAWEAAQGGAAS